ncbi:hypothetical protein N7492_002618 [Penicillium capsulatum]|uniref:Serine hydrolase domain-containing protein n=1 Tax=Penicillium capsulatum TaxID=69766 RepID=A0A9W9LVD5_9EURO|nr:hypothetical protein N7492_002618 [Penicillium capsulatum]KAJ6122781.1 hypothetical protein N7512_005246 [Penicillium capsulatum]
MRVLCLHGKGTSGAIFRSQTSSFRARLADKNIEFDWVDAPFDSDPAAGIDLFYPPPYYSFWEENNTTHIRAACTWVSDYIAHNGPYDVAIGFSQGCVLASSLLLYHQEETPHLPPPFTTAIFICGGPSMPVLEDLGFHVSAAARERDDASRSALALQSGSSNILTKGADRWKGLDAIHGGLSEDELRNEITSPYRISIPTVHVYGSKDPRYAAGVHLSSICDVNKRRTYDHGGGHEIPRQGEVTASIAKLVEWALEEATRGG